VWLLFVLPGHGFFLKIWIFQQCRETFLYGCCFFARSWFLSKWLRIPTRFS
jgi:hypothetical protein